MKNLEHIRDTIKHLEAVMTPESYAALENEFNSLARHIEVEAQDKHYREHPEVSNDNG